MSLYADLTEYSTKGEVLLVGDFNARTASKQSNLVDYEADQLILPQLDPSETQTERSSEDHGDVTAYGQALLELGVAHDLVIYNGMHKWPQSGGLTCFPHGGGSSTVDYVMGPPGFASRILDLKAPPPPLGADHTYIHFGISDSHVTPLAPRALPAHTRVHFDHELDDVYDFHLYRSLWDLCDRALSPETPLSAISERLAKTIHDIAQKCFPVSVKPERKERVGSLPQNPWFDAECTTFRLRILKWIEQGFLTKDLGKKNFQKITRRKQRAFLAHRNDEIIQKFHGKEQLEAWDILREVKAPISITDPATWFSYAQRLYDVPNQAAPDMSGISRPTQTDAFTIGNVKNALFRLSTGRARDHEDLLVEHFSHGAHTLAPILSRMFNSALCYGFPASWSSNTIVPIYKAGDPMEPANYRTIMVSHTLAKIYGSVVERHISDHAESFGHRALGQAGFRRQHSTLDHIFTLRAIIEEARYHKKKVYCCFVDFRKAFDTVPRARLIRRLREIGVHGDMVWAVASLYESVTGRVKAPRGWSSEIHSTIGVKQGCPLSPTLFGIYIDEIVDFIDRGGGEGASLGGSHVSILLYADDIVLISNTPQGLQRHLDALQEFCVQRDLRVNLEKTKVMVFNTSRRAMRRLEFMFNGEKVEVASSYVYLGVLFSGPIFNMAHASRARLAKGHAALSRLERQCFQAHFQDPGTKCTLFDTLVRPAAMYGAAFWGPDLGPKDWARVERLQILMCSRMIRSKKSVPHPIIQAEFAVTPLQIDAIFQSVTYLQRLDELVGIAPYRLPVLAMSSSRYLAQQGDTRSWYYRVQRWFARFGLSMDHLPPFQYSLDSPFYHLPHQERNRLIRADLLQLHTHKTWQTAELSTKLHFYREHFLRFTADGFIQRPGYLTSHMSHALRIALGQIRVSSHQLRVESGRASDTLREERLCTLCSLGEVESEEHYMFRCHVYFEIRGRYHCLFEDGFGPLARVIDFPDQKCLAIFLLEIQKHRTQLLRSQPRCEPSEISPTDQHCITEFFQQVDDNANDSSRRKRRQTHTQVVSQSQRTRPRLMVTHTIQRLLTQQRGEPRGVTVGMAQRLKRSRRSRTSSRLVPSGRQLQISEILDRHRRRPDPSVEESRDLLRQVLSEAPIVDSL